MRLAIDIVFWCLRAACAALMLAAAPAEANWLSKIAREAGEAGPRVAQSGARGFERAAAHLKALPATAGADALAAHATPEGHWRFANRAGEVFTAGTPDELKRAVPTLLPGTAADSKLTIYLSEDTIFGERALLKDLPETATLRIVVGNNSYPLVARRGAGGEMLYAAVRPNLEVELGELALFNEGVAQLERPLSRANIRTLALEPGGPAALPSSPRFDPETRSALVDAIDPVELSGALRSVRGQTVLVTGRIEENLLLFRPPSSAEQSLKVIDLIEAAAAADVNLVILQAPVPRQPGGRNWLWQRIAVGGLDDALKRATFGDFLDALAANRGAFRVAVMRDGGGRVVLRAIPDADAEPLTGMLGSWLSSAASSITGNVITSAVEVHARDEARQAELDRRLVPFIPSGLQVAYLVSLIAGLLGWPMAATWWQQIWPKEERNEYRGEAGYRAAQGVRLVAFVLLFLPVAGVPALIAATALQLFGVILLPVRLVGRLTGRASVRAS
jgi:hypothetical protein